MPEMTPQENLDEIILRLGMEARYENGIGDYKQGHAIESAASYLRRIASGEYAPVVHAHWTIKQDMEDRKGLFIRIVRSNCGLHTGMKSNFCPLCGADMRQTQDGKDDSHA